VSLTRKYTDIDCQGKVATLVLARGVVLNAVNTEFATELLAAATYLAGHPDIRVVSIRGEGRAFCTGIDLKELSAGDLPFSYFGIWEKALRTFETMNKIVVVGLHGYALGGGLQLALAADVRVSTRSCLLGLPAIGESLIPGLGPWRLARMVGTGRARDLVVSGRWVSGSDAYACGLVDRLADDGLHELDTVVKELLATCSQGALASKQLLARLAEAEYERALSLYLELQQQCYWGPDGIEARRAYQAKEDPRWL